MIQFRLLSPLLSLVPLFAMATAQVETVISLTPIEPTLWQDSKCIQPKTVQEFDYVECLNKKGVARVGNVQQTPFGDMPYPLGLVNKTGEVILPAEYHRIYFPSDWEYDNSLDMTQALILVQKRNLNQNPSMFGKLDTRGDRYGLVNTQGEFVVSLGIYDEINEFYDDGLASVMKNGKYGFVDTAGELIIPLKYDYAFAFSEGLASVESQGKFGFINTQNKVVIPFIYDHADSFSDGLAVVEKDGYEGMIDKTGSIVVDFDYDLIMPLHYANLYRAKKKDKFGVIDDVGNTIVPFLYDYIDTTLTDDGKAIIYGKLSDNETFYSFDGKVLEVE